MTDIDWNIEERRNKACEDLRVVHRVEFAHLEQKGQHISMYQGEEIVEGGATLNFIIRYCTQIAHYP